MEKKLLKKLLIVLMIVMLMSTDFLVLGANLISYASTTDNATNNKNIEFSTYFKNEKGERVQSLSENINKSDLKLYAEVEVKEEGYFNGSIELENSNFNIRNEILSSEISKIEGNTVTLKQINAGSKVEIELAIEPIISEKMSLDKFDATSTVKLTGTYMENTYKGKDIKAEKEINLKLVADESTSAELNIEIVTNKVFSINGENKRVIQLIVKSRITDNNYPVKQTLIKTEIPQLSGKSAEEVKVVALGTEATNGIKENIAAENVENKDGNVQITIQNNANENNEISWKKNVYDQFILTFIYAEDVDASKVEFKTNSEIEIYNKNGKVTAEHTVGIENQELNNIIVSRIKMDNAEIYKGQLYANVKAEEKKEIAFKTKTEIEVRSTEIADSMILKEEKDTFVTDATELDANTKYKSTKINKDNMLKILGNDGFVEIKYGEFTTRITKDSQTDEDGNITIEYKSEIRDLEITTSKPVNTGILELVHTKAIMANSYTTEQIREIKALKSTNSITAMLGETKVVENTTEQSKELKETVSNAELTINKQSLSTMAVNKEVIIGVKLNTAETKYDLYKNPTIRIQLPQSVEDININAFDKLYSDEFTMEKAVYDKVNKVIEIVLKGEQLTYPESEATQLYLQINADITLNKMQPSKEDKITMEYTNENAIQSVNVIEKPIKIVSPSGLVTMNNAVTYNIETITGSSEDKQLATVNKNTAGGTEARFDIALINNTGNAINNVQILGNFPTDGQFVRGEETITNNFATTLKGEISAQNCTIYYSENMSATADLTDESNGWSTDLKAIANPKAYLIVIPTMDAETNFTATYTMILPTTLSYDLTSYAGYKVMYTEGLARATQEAQSPLVGVTTGESVKLETTIEATVGNDTLKDGDTVKTGEVIKYRVTTKNTGTQDLENVVVKAGIPTGTVLVVPEEDYVYSGASYYEEKSDITEFSETIPSLAGGQSYTSEYEVRVKTDTASGTQLSNKASATYGEFTIDSNEIKHITGEAKIRATVKRVVGETAILTPGTVMEYMFIIENLSDEDVNNLKLEMILENQEISVIKDGKYNTMEVSEDNQMDVGTINANGILIYKVYTRITEQDINGIGLSFNVVDSNNNIYRSNKDGQKVESIGATIKLTSDNAGEFVNVGDEIIYKYNITNTGNIKKSMILQTQIPEYLEIKGIYNDDKVAIQTTDINDGATYTGTIGNDLQYYITLEAGQTMEVKVVTKVKETEEQFATKTITNSAKIMINNMEKATSEEVSHILQNNIDEKDKHIISGLAWLDVNQDGKKDANDKVLENIKVILYDVSTNSIAKNKDGKNAETVTNSEGQYTFTRINEGSYLVLFEYDTTQYELTTYMAEGVSESQNSNVILKTINMNGQDKVYAVTDTIKVTESISNINLGLKELLTYDLELDKYISRIVVQTSKETKTYDYQDSTFQKVEIHRKQLNGAVVILEYNIRVKNTGKIAGYVTSIKDYMPSGLEFSSELNPDWYLSGEDLHTKSLANTRIEPGETKDIKLILTRTMTDSSTGLINNRAEIEDTYNEYGKQDIDSIVNNAAKDEDDLGSADVIISVSTGGRIIAYTLLVMINTGLIAIAIYLIFIKNRHKR